VLLSPKYVQLESTPSHLTYATLNFSNGSGKSSLAAAILWCLTGSMDPRPVQDAKVADVVNDYAKVSTSDGFLFLPSFSLLRSDHLNANYVNLFC